MKYVCEECWAEVQQEQDVSDDELERLQLSARLQNISNALKATFLAKFGGEQAPAWLNQDCAAFVMHMKGISLSEHSAD